MLVLALDTTTRTGSLALARDGTVLECVQGDPARTHAERLPTDILALLSRHHCSLTDVELYGVAAGPGSFTGLRIGIATIQGLAFANGRPVVPVSALEALAYAAALDGPPNSSVIGVWMDAQRGEIFSALYIVDSTTDGWPSLRVLDDATVDDPERTAARWRARMKSEPVAFTGEGALVYRRLLDDFPSANVARVVPATAAAIAGLATKRALAGAAIPPHAVQPIYVRRPDAELARSRRTADLAAPAPPISSDRS